MLGMPQEIGKIRPAKIITKPVFAVEVPRGKWLMVGEEAVHSRIVQGEMSTDRKVIVPFKLEKMNRQSPEHSPEERGNAPMRRRQAQHNSALRIGDYARSALPGPIPGVSVELTEEVYLPPAEEKGYRICFQCRKHGKFRFHEHMAVKYRIMKKDAEGNVNRLYKPPLPPHYPIPAAADAMNVDEPPVPPRGKAQSNRSKKMNKDQGHHDTTTHEEHQLYRGSSCATPSMSPKIHTMKELRLWRKLIRQNHQILRSYAASLESTRSSEPYCVMRTIVEYDRNGDNIEAIMRKFHDDVMAAILAYLVHCNAARNELTYKTICGNVIALQVVEPGTDVIGSEKVFRVVTFPLSKNSSRAHEPTAENSGYFVVDEKCMKWLNHYKELVNSFNTHCHSNATGMVINQVWNEESRSSSMEHREDKKNSSKCMTQIWNKKES
ncbi:hypothetical protein TELCIR_07060 [Teladorsagia circumcincta]|uniref:Uncharacterized protein n=1 Tax=Teladorsagia circumcincta TaxID=45464 RepID=A0A2G9UMV1_TELCI|nr:hypothetical protein TELCIR_07060 [Teladorsagia circumcincta]